MRRRLDVFRTDNRAGLGQAAGLARDRCDVGVLPGAAAVPVVDTTELRWFAPGRLPIGVESWFTGEGTIGTVEERCDSYRMDGRRRQGRQAPVLGGGDEIVLAHRAAQVTVGCRP